MAQESMRTALELLSDMRRAEVTTRLGISAEEIARWGEISRRMVVPFHDDGIISQFEGYDNLPELDWEGYRARYGNIHRLDLILEAEADSANRYRLAKQADAMMLFYLFFSEELRQLFERLGYPFDIMLLGHWIEMRHPARRDPPGRATGGGRGRVKIVTVGRISVNAHRLEATWTRSESQSTVMASSASGWPMR